MTSFYCFDENGTFIGDTVSSAESAKYIYVANAEDTIYQFDKANIFTEGLYENNDILYRFGDEWEEIVAGKSYDTILKFIKDEELIKNAYTAKEPKKAITAYRMECASTVGASLSKEKKTYTLYIAFTDTELIKIAQGSLMEISDTMNTLEKICNANKITRFVIE